MHANSWLINTSDESVWQSPHNTRVPLTFGNPVSKEGAINSRPVTLPYVLFRVRWFIVWNKFHGIFLIVIS